MTTTATEILVSVDNLNTIYELLNQIQVDNDGGYFICEENEDLFEEVMCIMRGLL